MEMGFVGERIFKSFSPRKGSLSVQSGVTGDQPETAGNANKKNNKDCKSSITRHCIYFGKTK